MKIRFITILFIILFLSCFKRDSTIKNNNQETQIIEKDYDFEEIDNEKLKNIIDKSEQIDVKVFFAISILHKNFIDQFIDSVKDKTEEEQKKFFEEKNIEFFNKIKYSEEQYLEFQKKNEKALIDYLNRHPELMKYLVTIN